MDANPNGRFRDEGVEADAVKRATASDRTKSERREVCSRLLMASFLINQGEPDKVRKMRNCNFSNLHLLVVHRSDHQTGAA